MTIEAARSNLRSLHGYAMKSDAELDRVIVAVLRGVREPSEGMETAWFEGESGFNDHPVEFYLNRTRYQALIDHLIQQASGA